MNKSLMAALLLGGVIPHHRRTDNPLDEIDLQQEYELIKQKKSKLSANKGRLVMREMDKNQ